MAAIVRLALERPYTFIVMAMFIMLAGVASAIRLPVDIFPDIPVPVIATAFQYAGLSPDDMSQKMINGFERILTTTVNDIEHIESTSLQGLGVVKIFLQPGTDVRTATAQVTAVSQTAIRQMPPGTTPPLVLNYSASTVPIIQLAVSGQGMNEQQLFDMAFTQIRPPLVTVPGAAIPLPYGGKQRQIQIDLDPQALHSKGLSAQDVSAAIAAQNQINPAGFAKIGTYQYEIKLNNSPGPIDELNATPIKSTEAGTVFMRDVANVRDGAAPQTNIVHVEGRRAVLMNVLKSGATSTLAIVQGIKDALPKTMTGLPSTARVTLLNDQSIFVGAAITGVITEGAIAAVLTSLMILLFLGSWRSTVIIALSIPLSIFGAVALLAAFGQTLNIMTLGGLALAVGILVDDATVTIENINWHLEHGKDVRTAILDGAQQIVAPAFVSTICICIVFVPMFFLPGVSGFLFVPMALSVMFAMATSFVLSRTLVPTMSMYLLKPHDAEHHDAAPQNRLIAFQRGFEKRFLTFRSYYAALLKLTMEHRKPFVIGFLAVVVASFVLVPMLGRNFFPSVDAGQIALHVRAPMGTRVEETAILFDRIQQEIRKIIPAEETRSIADNIGMPNSSINYVYSSNGSVSSGDGDILIGLNAGHAPTDDYVRTLREQLPRLFPEATFSFLPADIVSQILNFGSPAPIDIQVAGRNLAADEAIAIKILHRLRAVPGLADARIQQSSRLPVLHVDVDRTRVGLAGLKERDVTGSLGGALAGSSQTSPVFWVDPATGVNYSVVAQMPEREVDSLNSLENIPVSGTTGGTQVLGGLAEISRAQGHGVITHYDIDPIIDIYATTQDRDLGGVTSDINDVIASMKGEIPPTVTVRLRGQAVTMDTAFSGLSIGLAGAIVLIYLLIVVNFQSWLDPFVIITALPGALAGIVWMLFATHTTLSVPALTGAIMCMGVATANSILVVSFARERLNALGDATAAAFDAGVTRFRPVLMTALAMIIGMTPMALGLGEGGEQNAPLGRAVIGGLVVATIATLLFVPVVFSIVHGRKNSEAVTSQGEVYA